MKKLFVLFTFSVFFYACAFRSGMMTNAYPVEVFWDKSQPSRAYEVLGNVVLKDERFYSNSSKNARKELLTYYGNLPRGYKYDEKEILIYQLTKKAKEMGADAVMNINYQLNISQNKYGYDLSCVALKYTQNDK
ncbi:MAG: hypothetical protein SFU27_12910 [Thermonemataceae bacterium]|nr:hypothetical protein [Thermonemataceae bacterium]